MVIETQCLNRTALVAMVVKTHWLEMIQSRRTKAAMENFINRTLWTQTGDFLHRVAGEFHICSEFRLKLQFAMYSEGFFFVWTNWNELSTPLNSFKSQSMRSESFTPSPTGYGSDTPEASSQSPDRGVVWAVTDLASVPKGSVIIDPQTLQPILNQDGWDWW